MERETRLLSVRSGASQKAAHAACSDKPAESDLVASSLLAARPLTRSGLRNGLAGSSGPTRHGNRGRLDDSAPLCLDWNREARLGRIVVILCVLSFLFGSTGVGRLARCLLDEAE